ncbi:MAG: VCBS repeat-containing protein [Polyangiaceae bacterium]|nr:VCBS repeat-containing protein [Polyangiaceae bacterium]
MIASNKIVLGLALPLVVASCDTDSSSPTEASNDSGADTSAVDGAAEATSGGASSGGTAGTAGTSSGGTSTAGSGTTGGTSGDGGIADSSIDPMTDSGTEAMADADTEAGFEGICPPWTEADAGVDSGSTCGNATNNACEVCYESRFVYAVGEGNAIDVAIGNWSGGSSPDVIHLGGYGMSYFSSDWTTPAATETVIPEPTGFSTSNPYHDLEIGQLTPLDDSNLDIVWSGNTSRSYAHLGHDPITDAGVTESIAMPYAGEGPTWDIAVADIIGSPPGDDIAFSTDEAWGVHIGSGYGEGYVTHTEAEYGNSETGRIALADLSPSTTYVVLGNDSTSVLRRRTLTWNAPDASTMLEFGDAELTTIEGTTVALKTADLNGDNNPDIIVVLGDADKVNVLFGDGAGGFIDQGGKDYVSVDVGTGPRDAGRSTPSDVAIGDLDGDGHPDMAITLTDDDAISVLFGDGAGNFSTPRFIDVGAGTGPTRLEVGRLNGDDIDDIAVACPGSEEIKVLLSDP